MMIASQQTPRRETVGGFCPRRQNYGVGPGLVRTVRGSLPWNRAWSEIALFGCCSDGSPPRAFWDCIYSSEIKSV